MHNTEDEQPQSLKPDAHSRRLNEFVFTDGDGTWPVMTDELPPGLHVTFTVLRTDEVEQRLMAGGE